MIKVEHLQLIETFLQIQLFEIQTSNTLFYRIPRKMYKRKLVQFCKLLPEKQFEFRKSKRKQFKSKKLVRTLIRKHQCHRYVCDSQFRIVSPSTNPQFRICQKIEILIIFQKKLNGKN